MALIARHLFFPPSIFSIRSKAAFGGFHLKVTFLGIASLTVSSLLFNLCVIKFFVRHNLYYFRLESSDCQGWSQRIQS